MEAKPAGNQHEVDHAGPRGAVYFVPFFCENPYQRQLANELRAVGVDVCHTAGPEKILRTSKSNGAVRRILHIHWLPTFPGGIRNVFGFVIHLARIWLISRRGIRIVWTAHNLYGHESNSKRMDWLFSAAVARICKRIIVHSPRAEAAVANEFLAGNTRRIQIIPHGNYVDAYPNSMTQADARRLLHIPDNRLVITFVGNLRPYKGVDRLMRVLRSIDNSEVMLLVAGSSFDDTYTDQLSALAKRDTRIVFHPRFLRDDEMQIYFNAADAIAFPYQRILTSGAVLLAMSFGRACLAPNLGSIPDYVNEECGVLFDTESDEGLHRGVEQIIKRRRELPQMGACALRRCLRWRWREIATATLMAYDIPLTADEAAIVKSASQNWWHGDGSGQRSSARGDRSVRS